MVDMCDTNSVRVTHSQAYFANSVKDWLHLMMHRTVELIGYIGPLTLSLTLIFSSFA